MTYPVQMQTRELSPAEWRCWFLHESNPDSGLLNHSWLIRLQGSLDENTVTHSLDALLPVPCGFRWRFPLAGERPSATPRPRIAVQWRRVDLDAADTLREACRREAAEPFRLDTGPALRLVHYFLAGETAGLQLTWHAIYAGPSALPILVNAIAGQQTALPGSRELIPGDGRAYWQSQLADLPSGKLPLDRRGPADSISAGLVVLNLPPEVLSQLPLESEAARAVLTAATATLLARITGEPECGLIWTGEPQVDFHPKCVENPLPLRIHVGQDATFENLTAHARDVLSRTRLHAGTPFDELVRTHWQGGSHGFPFADASIDFQPDPAPSPGLAAECEPVLPPAIETSVAFRWEESRGALRCLIRYRTCLFEQDTVQRWSQYLVTLLAAALRNPKELAWELPLGAAKSADTVVTLPKAPDLGTAIDQALLSAPHSIAIRCGDASITRAGVDSQSQALAARLRSMGAGPEFRVAICLERSLSMAVCILGVLRAGACFVPLDPRYPRERLRLIVEDSGAQVLITRGSPEFPVPPDCRILDLSLEFEDAPAAAQSSGICSPSDAAYVIYTSGTTGRPKGVVIERSNLSHYIAGMSAAIRIEPGDVYLHTASFAFSSSIRQLFLPLLSGAEVVIATADEIADPIALFERIDGAGVTVADLVPTYWSACQGALAALPPGPRARLIANRLRLILSASEVLWSDVPHRWRGHLGHPAEMVNMFGQTETCGIVCTHPINPVDATTPFIVSIGKPIPGVEILVLDSRRRPVPAGVVGEIHVTGPTVGRGYHNLPADTQSRFFPHPEKPGLRIYRTGDRGRITARGDIEFLGREDHQVKIRGHRVELAEVEAAIRRHPSVRECAVAAVPSAGHSYSLAAYYVPADRAALPGDLRDFVAEILAPYLVPSFFVAMDALPLTSNGKIDRKALPSPQSAADPSTREQPRNETERLLASIWSEVLDRPHIGLRENFFHIGGDSLRAVAMFSRIRSKFGRSLPLAAILRSPTIERMAAELQSRIERSSPDTEVTCIVPIRESGAGIPFYCVHGVGGTIVEYYHLAQYMHPDHPFFGIQAAGVDGGSFLDRVEQIAARYISELRRVQPEGPYMLGGNSFGGLIAWEMAQQLTMAGQEVALLALFDTWGPGYPRFHKPPGAWTKMRNRFALHWGDLKRLDGTRRREYLAEKFANASARAWRLGIRSLRKTRRWLEWQLLPPALREARRQGRKALQRYAPRPYSGPVTLFRAANQPPGALDDPTNGFSALAVGRFEVVVVPGFHAAIVREPQVRGLAQRLNECMEKLGKAAGESPLEELVGDRTSRRG